MKLYPILKEASVDGIFEWLKYVVRSRSDDIKEFDNLDKIFVLGRKVGKIPAASNDVIPEDKIGDINYDPDYLYILIDNAGTAEWRRATLGAW